MVTIWSEVARVVHAQEDTGMREPKGTSPLGNYTKLCIFNYKITFIIKGTHPVNNVLSNPENY